MRMLLQLIKWDALLIYKYGIVAVAISISLMYSIAFYFFQTKGFEHVVAAVIFSDPVMYGFLFTAILILFEKDAQTHQVLAVTPVPYWVYLASKTIVFSILALFCSYAIILAAQPTVFHPLLFFAAVVLSASLFVFIAIIGVSYVQNFNQFILLMPIVLAPVCLPFLGYFGWYQSIWFYLIPTQACLLLFKSAVMEISMADLYYAIIYLLVWNFIATYFSLKCYKRKILKTT